MSICFSGYLATNPLVQNAVLKNLAKGQLYEICVKVRNSKGEGPCAEETQLTSPDLPGAPFVFEHKASQVLTLHVLIARAFVVFL